MKLLALGGSGGMGRFAVETAMHFDNIEHILVADINETSALTFAESMNEKVSGIGLDITNTEKLKEIMRSMDIVINTVEEGVRSIGLKKLLSAIADDSDLELDVPLRPHRSEQLKDGDL